MRLFCVSFFSPVFFSSPRFFCFLSRPSGQPSPGRVWVLLRARVSLQLACRLVNLPLWRAHEFFLLFLVQQPSGDLPHMAIFEGKTGTTEGEDGKSEQEVG